MKSLFISCHNIVLLVQILGGLAHCRHFLLHNESYHYKQFAISLDMKLFQCKTCHAILRYEADKEEHSKIGALHNGYNEYELDEFLTRFLVTA